MTAEIIPTPAGIEAGIPTAEEIQACFDAMDNRHPLCDEWVRFDITDKTEPQPVRLHYINLTGNEFGDNIVIIPLSVKDRVDKVPPEALRDRNVMIRADITRNFQSLMRWVAKAKPEAAVAFGQDGSTWKLTDGRWAVCEGGRNGS